MHCTYICFVCVLITKEHMNRIAPVFFLHTLLLAKPACVYMYVCVRVCMHECKIMYIYIYMYMYMYYTYICLGCVLITKEHTNRIAPIMAFS